MNDWLKANSLTLITAAVAVYGAVLATLNYRQSRADKRRRLAVRLSWGFLTYGPGMGTQLSDQKCLITISNPGHAPATLRSVHISGGRMSIPVPPECGEKRLPHEIPPGQGCTFWVGAADMARALASKGLKGKIKLRGVAADGTDEQFFSKPFTFDVDELKDE